MADMIQLELGLAYLRPVEEKVTRRLDAVFSVEYLPRAVCTCCGERKSIVHFTRDHRNTGRHYTHSHCHDCRANNARRQYGQQRRLMA